MKILQLMNRQQQVVGNITWMPPDQISVDIANASLALGVQSILAQAKENGLPLRVGGPIEREGKEVIIERVEHVKMDDERFLRALADVINRVNFSGQRIFGLLKGEGLRRGGI